MRERPIHFTDPMVRALVAGTKTQARRVCRHQPHVTVTDTYGVAWPDGNGTDTITAGGAPGCYLDRSPYRVGDRLWVREAFYPVHSTTDGRIIEVDYRADYSRGSRMGDYLGLERKWQPGVRMPREACRLTLEIAAVRVERLQEISYQDAYAEGMRRPPGLREWSAGDGSGLHATPQLAFAHLRNTACGDWNSNPWVWAITFKRIEA
ncbi:hypothetical protein J3A72_003218 [Stenotrophomonas sp. PvP093]|jgi:hypothetical protein|uniref:Morphogenetic protein n=1 Tax=Stenotrophomonas pavanii TaxID=487698 RepID=A0A2D0ANZ7_9GAMM|nr:MULTISPECIES: hypothetical protein [Stenotrophomonas]MBP2482926.1 hypothetical protein [Stenotrophomonas sp. PvP093]OWR35290.1 hypothetical protein CEE55_02475 [Stenotrophomonas pavanii]